MNDINFHFQISVSDFIVEWLWAQQYGVFRFRPNSEEERMQMKREFLLFHNDILLQRAVSIFVNVSYLIRESSILHNVSKTLFYVIFFSNFTSLLLNTRYGIH